MNIDMWYGDKIEECTHITQSFNDLSCETSGWIYKGNKIVGDYCGNDSVEIQEYFEGKGFKFVD